MADYEEEDVVTLVPDPITGLPPPIFGYDGVDKDLGYYDYFVMSALLIAFCGAIVSERNCNALRLFELMEIVITSLFGIACYFVPSFIFNVLVGGYDCDIIHMLLVQANGAALLGLAGCRIRFFCAGKMTKSGQSSLVFARLIGGIALLITLATDQQHCSLQDYKHKLSNMHVAFAITGCALWILGNGIVLWNFPGLGHFCVNSRLRVNLIVDIIATSLIAFWWYGYPEYTLYNLVVPEFKPDGIHAHFLRTLACLVLINILHGVGSIRFHENVDRQGYFFSNLIVYFLLVPLVVAQQSTLKLYGTGSFIMYIVLIAVLLVNCFIGYMNPQCPCACVGSLLEGTFDPCKDSCKDNVDPCKDSEDPRKSFSKGNLKGSSKKDCRKEGKKEPKKGGKAR